MTTASTDRYLERIGLDPEQVGLHPEQVGLDADGNATADRETLARLQRAHVTAVPFENLAITGDPYGPREGEGVTLTLPHLYEKLVERERGGFCFELNGLFGWLLSELGFDVDRISARVVGADGDARPPANHHSHLVTLDREYVADVGLGRTAIRRPLPLDGETYEDEAGIEWRVVESKRPDAEYVTQLREPHHDEWNDRYVFDTAPRKLSFFEATCEYLATAPDSPFTGDPSITVATDQGYKQLTRETLTRYERGEETEREVAEDEWHDLLAAEFGIRLGSA